MTWPSTALRCGAALLLGAAVCVGPSAAAGEPEPVELGGATVVPSTDPASPTTLTAGVWADVLGAAELAQGTHEFAYERTMADSTVHLGVVGAPTTADGGDALSITARAPDGAGNVVDCASDQGTSSYQAPQRLIGAGLSVGADDDRDDPCLTADELTFTVDRYTSSATSDLPIAIRVVEEAPVIAAGELPAPPESPSVAVPEPGEPVAAEESTSFDRAPDLEPGTTYAGVVAQGGTALYRVHLGWGESLAVRVDVPTQDAAAAATLGSREPRVELALLDPLRDVFGGEVAESEESGAYAADEPAVLVEGAAPVAYRNRFEGVAGSVPGDYWVTVVAEAAADDETPVDVPFTLVAEVTEAGGDTAADGDGAPTYSPTVQSPGGDAGPAGYTADAPYLVATGVFTAEVASDAAAVGADPKGTPARDHLRLAGGILLGAISLGCCAAGLALLRRRPRPPG